MSVEGRAARDARGDVIERPVPIKRLGTAYVRPLQYGDSLRFFENRERTPRMLAALFRRSVAGFEDCTPTDVRGMVAGMADLLEYAVVAASGLIQSEREAEQLQSDEDDLYEGHDVPEPRAMSPESGSAEEEATATLDEFEEADLVAFLHSENYTWDGIYQLLTPEIDELKNGVERRELRKERQRKQNQRSNTSGQTAGAYQKGNDEPPGSAPGFR